MMLLLFLALAVCACSLRGTDSPGGGENPAEASDAVSGPFAAGGAAGEESAPGDGVIRESLGHGTDAGDPEEQERLELSRKGIYSISGFQSGADGQPKPGYCAGRKHKNPGPAPNAKPGIIEGPCGPSFKRGGLSIILIFGGKFLSKEGVP